MAKPPIERRYIILRWHYKPTPGLVSRHVESYPVSEDVYPDFASAAADVASGQVEPLVQGVEIDLDAGTATDITADLLNEAAEIQDARRQRDAEGW